MFRLILLAALAAVGCGDSGSTHSQQPNDPKIHVKEASKNDFQFSLCSSRKPWLLKRVKLDVVFGCLPRIRLVARRGRSVVDEHASTVTTPLPKVERLLGTPASRFGGSDWLREETGCVEPSESPVPVEEFADGEQTACLVVAPQGTASPSQFEGSVGSVVSDVRQAVPTQRRISVGDVTQQAEIALAPTTCVRPDLSRTARRATHCLGIHRPPGYRIQESFR